MKTGRRVFSILLCVCMLASGTMVSAHSGETHSHGGHHGNGNANGSRSYYCGGHSAHFHTNGVCPYATASKTGCAGKKSKYYKTSTICRVQKKLNKLGYKCGRADGCCGSRTKKAIKKFQRKKGIAVNGKITRTLLKKLHVSV